jgi:hypothetical protein
MHDFADSATAVSSGVELLPAAAVRLSPSAARAQARGVRRHCCGTGRCLGGVLGALGFLAGLCVADALVLLVEWSS